jgi:hypothetical protein
MENDFNYSSESDYLDNEHIKKNNGAEDSISRAIRTSSERDLSSYNRQYSKTKFTPHVRNFEYPNVTRSNASDSEENSDDERIQAQLWQQEEFAKKSGSWGKHSSGASRCTNAVAQSYEENRSILEKAGQEFKLKPGQMPW